MRPTHYGAAFARFWWIIALAVLLGAGLMVVRDRGSAPDYQSTARVAVLPTPVQAETTTDKYYLSVRAVQANAVAKTRMDLYASLIDDPTMATALQDSGTSATNLRDQVKVTIIGDSTSLAVAATDADAARAQQLAGKVAEALATLITDVEQERRGETLLRGAVVGQTSAPTAAAAPRWRNPLIGGFAGLSAGLGLAIILFRFDPRARGRQDFEALLAAPVLGVVPARASGRRAASSHGNPAIDEVRTQLYFRRQDESRALTIAVTGTPTLRSGAVLVTDLTSSLAETGARVLLIDAGLDSDHDRVAGGSVGPDGGLAQVLLSGQRVQLPGHRPGTVDILPAGATQPHGDDLLHGTAFGTLLDDAAALYDYIVVWTEPLAHGTGALAVAARADVTVIASALRGTRRGDLSGARAELDRLGANVAGAVLVS